MNDILEPLNDSQRKAVLWRDGPLLVLAGPGSGKTRVLTTRIAQLLNESPNMPFRVLGLTFTHKAAEEMRGRMRELCPDQSRRATLTTFHAFATDVLRQHARRVGLRADFRLVTSKNEAKELQGKAVERVALAGGTPGTNIDVSASIETIYKQGLLPSEAARAFVDPATGDRLASIFGAYLDILREENAADFGALLVFARELLERRPVIAMQLRTTYPHVCVDEFQDTNVAQYRLLLLIAERSVTDLFVVADDDQIIYAWNGASTDRLRALRADFGVSILQLPENYRCPYDVVLLANTLISRNTDRSEEKADLAAIKEAGLPSVRLRRFRTFDDEIGWIADELISREDRGRCVVLARSWKPLQRAMEHFNQRGLQAMLMAKKDAFTSAPILWIDTLLRLISLQSASTADASEAFRKLEGVRVAAVDGADLRSWIAEALEENSLETATRDYLNGLTALIDQGAFLDAIMQTFTWFDAIREVSEPSNRSAWEEFDGEREMWMSNHADIVDRIDAGHLSIAVYLQELDLMPKAPIAGDQTIRCSTIHVAKGLEFQHVYLLGLAEEQLPMFQAVKKGDQSSEMEEERRNCFVAITRCEDSLTLTFSDEYFGWRKAPSRFIEEMGLTVPTQYG